MVEIQVLLFAQLKEQAGCRMTTAQLPTATTPADLIRELQLKGPVLCAVNEQQVELQHPLQDGDIVAFMPPMSGG